MEGAGIYLLFNYNLPTYPETVSYTLLDSLIFEDVRGYYNNSFGNAQGGAVHI
jgi:hypothetical protein